MLGQIDAMNIKMVTLAGRQDSYVINFVDFSVLCCEFCGYAAWTARGEMDRAAKRIVLSCVPLLGVRRRLEDTVLLLANAGIRGETPPAAAFSSC